MFLSQGGHNNEKASNNGRTGLGCLPLGDSVVSIRLDNRNDWLERQPEPEYHTDSVPSTPGRAVTVLECLKRIKFY